MSVPPVNMPALGWAAAAAGTTAGPWMVGSVVFGRVLERNPGVPMILQIEGLTVEADPPDSGEIPRQFQALVLRGGLDPLMEILPPVSGEASVAPALRAMLPRQEGLQPLLAALRALSRAPDLDKLPAAVRNAFARLEASIVERSELPDSDLLRDALRRSGLQLEHRLLEYARSVVRLPTASIDYDLKAALQRLATALEELPPVSPEATRNPPAPPPLLRLPLRPQQRAPVPPDAGARTQAARMLTHVQAALARIEIMQLEANPAFPPNACMLEIPVRAVDGFDVLQVRIERDAGDAASGASGSWTLDFAFDPPELGPIQGRIRLLGTQVRIDLWAQEHATVDALEWQRTAMSRRLGGSRLQLAQLRVRQGLPRPLAQSGHRLLDASV